DPRTRSVIIYMEAVGNARRFLSAARQVALTKPIIVTNAGGPGVLATDSLAAHGGDLASLSQQTIEELNQFLPPHWSHGNPVDVLGDADAERYAKAVEIVSKDRGADGLLVILAPQAMTDPTQTAEKIKRFANLDGKPILASWMGGASVAAGQAILNHANIPTFPY